MFGFKLVKDKELQGLQEVMTEYKRTLEDIGWINLNLDDQMGNKSLLGDTIDKIINRSRIYYYRNPLAGHWCHLTTWFTFGEGISKPKAKDEKNIQPIIDGFWDDPDNQLAMTSFEAQQKLCNKLQYEGNLYLALFVDQSGNVRVRMFNSNQVEDIILFPDDNLRPAFYKIRIPDNKYDFVSDGYQFKNNIVKYYPHYDMTKNLIDEMNIPENKKVEDVYIIHIKDNCDINDKKGVPVLYRGLDWMKAHKDTVADAATLVKSLSHLAWKKKVKGSAAQVNSIRNALHAKTDLSNFRASAGSTQVENEGVDTTAINTPTGGAVIAEKIQRQEKLMVAAASGLFEHYFGDPSTGNLATAKSMELPMIKKFVANQRLWADIYQKVLQFVINKKIEAGKLAGSVRYDDFISRNVYVTNIERNIDIDFPPIIESELKPEAEALEIAIRNKLVSKDTAARIFLLAANQNNLDEEIEKIEKQKDELKVPGPTKPQKINESLDNPKDLQDPGIKLVKKNNHVLERMNGYRKALAGNFRKLQLDIRENIKTAEHKGVAVGDVPDLENIINTFVSGMKDNARKYFPVAIDIGEKFLQSHLNKDTIKESLYEQNGTRDILLQERLEWNDEFIEGSLAVDIENKVREAMRQPYKNEAEFRKAVNSSVQKFESRMELYVGAFWTVEEDAVKESGKGLGIMCNFVGADDGSTCEGCRNELETNPHLLDEVEVPGTHECRGRCRHAIQIIEGSGADRI